MSGTVLSSLAKVLLVEHVTDVDMLESFMDGAHASSSYGSTTKLVVPPIMKGDAFFSLSLLENGQDRV